MSGGSAPLRFLCCVVGGWVCIRAALLAPFWTSPAATAAVPTQRRSAAELERVVALPDPKPALAAPRAFQTARALPRSIPRLSMPLPALPFERAAFSPGPATPLVQARASYAGQTIQIPALPVPSRDRRWSLSAWAFVRGGEDRALATGGLLSGSQAGVRITYRLTGRAHPLALSARLVAPLRRPGQSEAALGLDWKLLAGVPVHLLAERRQAVGREGRSAFTLTAFGGVDDVAVGPLRLDAYGQAGVAGARARDLFADGAARLTLPLDPERRLRIGAGAWAAVQPGVSRVDIGPHAEARLSARGAAATLSLDWRFRVAGEAHPGSGPALTLSAGF
jgi:hypothetical protein